MFDYDAIDEFLNEAIDAHRNMRDMNWDFHVEAIKVLLQLRADFAKAQVYLEAVR